MNKKGLDQRCTAMKILGNRNWEDYMWPHQIDKTPRLDPEVLSFLKKLNLSKLTGIFENEEVLSMEILLKLNNEDLKELNIKLVHRKIILEELTKVKQYRQEKMTALESPSTPSAVIEQPASDPPFLLISSSGASADYQSEMFGLYSKTEEMREDRSVYTQMHDDTKYGGGGSTYKIKLFTLSSDQGVWTISSDDDVRLRAATPSERPTSVTWQYKDYSWCKWHDDPALTVTSLSEKPSDCEVTISLSGFIKRDIMRPGMEGLYKAWDGSYCMGRPVLQHNGGRFTLYVWGGCWSVSPGVRDVLYLVSGSAPSMCPADPRAARDESEGRTHWRYWSKKRAFPESRGISIRCAKHSH